MTPLTRSVPFVELITSRSAQIRCSSHGVKRRPVCPPDTVELEMNVVRVTMMAVVTRSALMGLFREE